MTNPSETHDAAATPMQPIGWAISDHPVGYTQALAAMDAHARRVRAGEAAELIWLLEHPPLYTAGTSAAPAELLDANRFPVFETGRGGRFTYHGPGQRIAYVMLDVRARFGSDVRAFVTALEQWIIATLALLNVKGERRPGRVGIWVARPDQGPEAEDKIAALGIRISGGVSTHGIALNVDPDLGHYAGIVPCGISEHGVTSLADLGRLMNLPETDIALRQSFEAIFGPTVAAPAPPATNVAPPGTSVAPLTTAAADEIT